MCIWICVYNISITNSVYIYIAEAFWFGFQVYHLWGVGTPSTGPLISQGPKLGIIKKISKHIKILKNITIHYKKNYHKYHTSQYIRGYYYYWTNMYRYYKACYIFNHQVSTHRLPVSPTAPFSLGTLPFLVVLLHYSLNLWKHALWSLQAPASQIHWACTSFDLTTFLAKPSK